MSNSYAALRGALGVAVVSAQLMGGSVCLGGQRAHGRVAAGVPAGRETAHRAERAGTTGRGEAGAELAAPELEPPPAGDQAVWWALPRTPRLSLKIRAAQSRSAAAIGEARGATAIQVLPDALLAHRGDCGEWLAAVPAGYVCRQDVSLQPGYASAPPAQESALGWQRYRYGVVTAKQVSLSGAPGSYLRTTLHHGDGVTVLREVNGRAQLIGKTWLARRDVELTTPSKMAPINLAALPPGTRPAWLVPAAGESVVPAYAPGAAGAALSPLMLLPRYSLVFVNDAPASPGRVAVLLADETRAALKDKDRSKDRDKDGDRDAAEAGHLVELDAAVLRRFIPVAPPPEVGPEERWVDISLSEQVAAAYVGKTPLFATLVSTGKGNMTPPGSFFIYRKYLSQTMANQRGAASQYDFRQVPHAQFFNGRIGLHAVLWHDSLGEPVSHGCVNLSPAAAAQFFAFSGPALPPGWHSVLGVAPAGPSEPPGSAPTGETDRRACETDRRACETDRRPAAGESRREPADRAAAALSGTRVIVRR